MSAGLQLVLFGLPASGKSALLGALAEAARSQEPLLNGKLSERSQGLEELHKSVYENSSQPTAEEMVSYPVSFEAVAAPVATDAVLIDSSGRRAAEILGQQSSNGRLGRSSLARSLQQADTLILVADGSADPSQLGRDFGQLAAFVSRFEQVRSRRSEVGGLPVYLVLTKCDLLAKASDTASTWIQTLEERKRQIDEGFHKYLAQQEDRHGLAFGKLDLHVWATATGRPALADRPARPHEPYGVAELFRQCLSAASTFQKIRERAARRLHWTVAGTIGLVSGMLLVALGVFLSRPSAEVIALEHAVHGLVPAEGATPAERLKDPLDKKLARLRQLQQNPDYAMLPAATRAGVDGHVEEIEAYLKYNDQFLKKVRDPRFATRAEDLAQIDKNLAAVSPPGEYAAGWQETRVGKRPQVWRHDIRILRQEIAATEAWINEQLHEGKELKKAGYRLLGTEASAKERNAWLEQYKKYVSRDYPHRPRQLLPGAAGITYETVYRFDRIVHARKAWDDFKRSLKESVYKDIEEQAE